VFPLTVTAHVSDPEQSKLEGFALVLGAGAGAGAGLALPPVPVPVPVPVPRALSPETAGRSTAGVDGS
jgi:hypothetical protein